MSKEQEKNYVKGAKTIEAKKVLEKVTVKSGENKKDYTKKANKTDANFVSFLLFYKDICYFGVKKCLFFLGLGFHYIKNYIYNLFLKINKPIPYSA